MNAENSSLRCGYDVEDWQQCPIKGSPVPLSQELYERRFISGGKTPKMSEDKSDPCDGCDSDQCWDCEVARVFYDNGWYEEDDL
jgi:hypothetical protein